jgi:hypothetical protein
LAATIRFGKICGTKFHLVGGGQFMSDADDKLIHATDSLLALYRRIERSTLELPLISFMPLLIVIWAGLRLYFFLFVGIFLIIPVNFIILIRNLFPGHWKYRPFFLSHLYYVWLWIWRGEVPTIPYILFRPLLSIFIKAHFATRLRRLRLEVLDSELSDVTRSAILGRLDAALERWKSPRVTAVFWSVILPAIISLPTWYKQLIEFLGSLGLRMPTDVVVNFISENFSTDTLIILGTSAPGYLVVIPITAFLAKRGVFIGLKPQRVCFPGEQEGPGIYYSKEREILSSVGVRIRETPVDLWLLGLVLVLSSILVLLTWEHQVAWSQVQSREIAGKQFEIRKTDYWISGAFMVFAVFLAAFRRRRTGRL